MKKNKVQSPEYIRQDPRVSKACSPMPLDDKKNTMRVRQDFLGVGLPVDEMSSFDFLLLLNKARKEVEVKSSHGHLVGRQPSAWGGSRTK